MRRALVVVALLLSAAGAWWLWPATLGGRATYMVTEGISMLPTFHAGDLAIVAPADRYVVGDVVAYRSEALHELVLHRVQAVEGGRFVMRGDHNDHADPQPAELDDIVGRLLIRVPGGGGVLTGSSRIGVLLFGAALATGLALLGARRASNREAWSSPRRPAGPSSRRGKGRPLTGRRGCSHRHRVHQRRCPEHRALAWILPAKHSVPNPIGYQQNAAMAYTAVPDPGPAYPTGRLTTGDPVFLSLVPAIDVQRGVLRHDAGQSRARWHPGRLGRPQRHQRLEPADRPRRTGPLHRGRLRGARAARPHAVPCDRARRRVDDSRADGRLHRDRTGGRQPRRGRSPSGRCGRRSPRRSSSAWTTSSCGLTTGGDADRGPGDPVVVKASAAVQRATSSPTTVNVLGHRLRTASLREWPLAIGAPVAAARGRGGRGPRGAATLTAS
jgi:signal peptidase I